MGTDIIEPSQGSNYVMSPSYEGSMEMDDGNFGWKCRIQVQAGFYFSMNQ